MGYKERVSEFFQKPPKHGLKPGDLVTCSCHGGVAIVLELYDAAMEEDGNFSPGMNMAKIFWIQYPHDGVLERVWMHTIRKLRKVRDYDGRAV